MKQTKTEADTTQRNGISPAPVGSGSKLRVGTARSLWNSFAGAIETALAPPSSIPHPLPRHISATHHHSRAPWQTSASNHSLNSASSAFDPIAPSSGLIYEVGYGGKQKGASSWLLKGKDEEQEGGKVEEEMEWTVTDATEAHHEESTAAAAAPPAGDDAVSTATATAAPPSVSPAIEDTLQWSEATAKARQDDTIHLAAIAYESSMTIPAPLRPAAIPLPEFNSAPTLASASSTSPSSRIRPAARVDLALGDDSEAFFADFSCAACKLERESAGEAKCNWAFLLEQAKAACAVKDAPEFDRLRAQLENLSLGVLPEIVIRDSASQTQTSPPSFVIIPSLHRAQLWITVTVGPDPEIHAMWERYYGALLASVAELTRTGGTTANTSVESTPRSALPLPDAARNFSTPVPGGSPPCSKRKKFSRIAFGEILKDVERTFPSMRFFEHLKTPLAAPEAEAQQGQTNPHAEMQNNHDTKAAPPSLALPPARKRSASSGLLTLHHEHELGPGQIVLQRLLTAFSLHRPMVGYCQSLNFAAAIILLVFSSAAESGAPECKLPESLAFAIFCHILEPRLSFYTRSMSGCVADSLVFRDVVSYLEPDISAVLAKQNVGMESFLSSWILSLGTAAPMTRATHHAVLALWDNAVMFSSFNPVRGETDAPMRGTDAALVSLALALFRIHKPAFTSLYRPTQEQIMNIFLKLVGATTPMAELLGSIRCILASDSTPYAPEFSGVKTSVSQQTWPGIEKLLRSVAELRSFHRANTLFSCSRLSAGQLRRLERATGVAPTELQRLWECFVRSGQAAGEEAAGEWGALVSGSIRGVVQLRTALGLAVFSGHGAVATPHGAATHGRRSSKDGSHSTSHGHAHGHQSVDPSKQWKGSGIVQSILSSLSSSQYTDSSSELRSDPRHCIICVPPLPSSSDSAVLRTCPRCTWLHHSEDVRVNPIASKLAASGNWNASQSQTAVRDSCSLTCCLSCRCSCLSRSSPSSDTSVFGRLFSLFDSRGGLHRGWLDFEDFVVCASLFTTGSSNRAERIQTLFRMAQLGSEDVKPAALSASLSTEMKGRISRRDFIQLVAAFEELYHGSSVIVAPAATPGSSAAAEAAAMDSFASTSSAAAGTESTAPTQRASDAFKSNSSSPQSEPLLSSALASARLFCDMAFEKKKSRDAAVSGDDADDARSASPRAGPQQAKRRPSQEGEGSNVSEEQDERLSYESFAQFIVLHPLISSFFRLDAIVD